ncbi:MAG: type I restriction enzyme subunit R domain-containing protein, partial [Bacillota bacterium]
KKKIKEKYATERDIAEASSRIEKICLDIIKHYEGKIYPLKAQIVTVSREAAAKYQDTLQRLNAPESAVLISGDDNDKEIIKKYNTTPEKRQQFVERFKNFNSSLKIIIVCDMLLTGFDAPVEQVMYLDKPLKEHNLLQAIARVNRVYREKNYGLVVDYYGVFDDLKKALAIFNTRDVAGAVTPIRDEKPRLEANYREVMRFFAGVDINDLDQCILAFKEEDKRARFKQAFKDFARSMDIVMPDPIANPYREDLKTLGKIYRAVRNHYRDDNLNIKGVGDKVKRLIDKHIKTSDIKRLNEPVSILNEKEFNQVLDETKDEETRASEMEHAIRKEASVKMEENPVFYQSLRERLEEIIAKRKQGRLNFAEQIKEMEEIIDEMRNVRTRAEKLGFNKKEYALYELLVSEIEKKPADRVAEGQATYTAGDSDQINVNKRIKKLTQKIMAQIEQYTRIDLWKEKTEILQKMRKTIKVNLLGYEEYKSKLDELTTKIIKLSRNIFLVL